MNMKEWSESFDGITTILDVRYVTERKRGIPHLKRLALLDCRGWFSPQWKEVPSGINQEDFESYGKTRPIHIHESTD
jgi:hypothetical protein